MPRALLRLLVVVCAPRLLDARTASLVLSVIYYRCKCGAVEVWGSIAPDPCLGCKDCGTTPALTPDGHRSPRSHVLIKTAVDTDDGQAILSRCRWCLRTMAEL